MIWIAPSEKDQATDTLEKRLWAATEQPTPAPQSTAQYSGGRPPAPRLGFIFLHFTEVRFVADKKNPTAEQAIHGVEKTDETGRLCHEDFKEQLETLSEELETLKALAHALEQTVAGNVAEIHRHSVQATEISFGRS